MTDELMSDPDQIQTPYTARVQTTVGALVRLLRARIISSSADSAGEITLHLVGADEQELGPLTAGAVDISSRYDALFDFLLEEKYRKVCLFFIGPNLNSSLHRHEQTFLFRETLLVCARFDIRYYHEFVQSVYRSDTMLTFPQPRPSCCLLFNAGLWGYDSWKPTLFEFLSSSGLLLGVPLVVTSYTLEESEDDYDTIESIYSTVADPPVDISVSLEWIWDCEENPHKGASVERSTQPDSRVYVDSGFWLSCVAFAITSSFELDSSFGGGGKTKPFLLSTKEAARKN